MTTPTSKPEPTPQQPAPRINTPCPACGRAALMLDAGGRLVCAAVPGRDGQDGCPDPTRLARMCAAEQHPAPAPDWLAPVTDAECATAILRTAQWTPATREAMDRLLAARAEAYARWLASTDAGRLVSEGRELERKAAAALIEHASPWVARDLVVMDCDGLMVANCNSPEQGYSAIDNAVLIEACDPAKLKPLLTGLLALAEAAASDRAALATVTRERDEARAALRLSEARVAVEKWASNNGTNAAVDQILALEDRAKAAEARAEKAEAALAGEKASKDGAYKERNALVAALSKLFPASLERHPDDDADWENDWRWIVFIDFPTGQASWHIHDSELSLFGHLPRGAGRQWDGHNNERKYARLAALDGMAVNAALARAGRIETAARDYLDAVDDESGQAVALATLREALAAPGAADAPAAKPEGVPAQGEPEPEAWSDSPEPGLHWITEPDARAPDLVRVYVGGETRRMRFSHVGCTEVHDVEEYAAAGARWQRIREPQPPTPPTGEKGGAS